MLAFISPAKGFSEAPLPAKTQPACLQQAQMIVDTLRKLSVEELGQLMKISPELARLNYERYQQMDLCSASAAAMSAYQGQQYASLNFAELSAQQQDYLQDRVVILSGLYGYLRPFDAITPYRLEMQTRLSVAESKHLMDFWGDTIARALVDASEGCLVDLASKEYARVIEPHVFDTRLVRCSFLTHKGNKLSSPSVAVKQARGALVRYMALTQAQDAEDLKGFSDLGYVFDEKRSKCEGRQQEFVFIRQVEGDGSGRTACEKSK